MLDKVKFISDANDTLVGERVEVIGWVHQKRNIGKIIFLIIRDRTGKIQVVFKDLPQKYMDIVRNVSFEDILVIRGTIKYKNEASESNEYEVVAETVKVISNAKTPPILPTIIADTTEATRLKYRYLDLRTKEKSLMLIFRNNMQKLIDNYMRRKSFIHIHTPILSKATPEGARDFLVPSREYKNKFYALPQSPQIYKQLLMSSGVDRYYQISPSFRDEDARSDRHQEFYEIDIEASYVSSNDIQVLVTKLMKKLMTLVLSKQEIKENVSFTSLKHSTAIEKYGTDKPDLRFSLEIEKAKKYFDASLREKLGIDKPTSPILFLKKGEQLKNIESIIKKVQEVTNQHNYQRGFTIYWFNKSENQMYVHKYINNKGITKKLIIKDEDVPLSIVDDVLIIPKWQSKKIESWKKYSILSKIRLYWGKKYLINKETRKFAFVWIKQFPMFELERETGQVTSSHHPFTKPTQPLTKEMIENGKFLNLKSTSFDLVCNGYELGSGSERINDIELQKKVFECLGLKKETINEKFGFLLESMNYGTPPHAGIGLGFERILMVLLNKENIRDVIPFPKTADGFDLMTNSPSIID